MHHPWGVKENTLLKQLKIAIHASNSQNEVEGLVVWYINQNEPFYAKNAWSFGYFVSHYNKHLIAYRDAIAKEKKKEAIKDSIEKQYQDTIKLTRDIFTLKKDPIEGIVKAILDKYPNKTEADLAHAIKINSKIPFENVRKNTAIALCQVFGKEMYIDVYKKINEKKHENNIDKEQQRRLVLKEQLKKLSRKE